MVPPDYYIFQTSTIEWSPYTTADSIIKEFAAHQVWFLKERMPHIARMKTGDQVLFYVSGKGAMYFAWQSELAGSVCALDELETRLGLDLGLEEYELKVSLSKVQVWKSRVPIRPLIDELDFIKNKAYWSYNLRKAVVRIGEPDHVRVLSEFQHLSL